MCFLPESPFFPWTYGAESGEPGGLPSAQNADDPVHRVIHLVGCIHLVGRIDGIAAILPGYCFDKLRFIHLSRA
jgi:hypothetical protein